MMWVNATIKYGYSEESFPEDFFDGDGKVVADKDTIATYFKRAMVQDISDAVMYYDLSEEMVEIEVSDHP